MIVSILTPLLDHLQVTRQQVGKGGVPYIATHDGRTIRYPDPDIRVRLRTAVLHVLLLFWGS